ncbi:MAG: GNAT family N-acetyltransferase [Phycisphaerales bacterium]|nr:GNAT family N-acetyltransferase [Phycisphaerales bacterium]
MDVSIEPISEKYADSFHACLDSVAREKKFLAQTEAPPLERVRGFVKDSVKNDVPQFIAVDGRVVVGWCDIFPDWPETKKHCGSLGMGVLKDYRRHGIGARLLLATMAKAKKKGITRITLKVRADNAGAIRLYEDTGFVTEARLKNAMKFDGVFHDEFQMSYVEDEPQR